MRKSLKRNKALFGESVAAAGIIAGATLAASAANTAATISGAKQQADATIKNAEKQSKALIQQNENANNNQQQMIEFTKSENQLNRDLQREGQLNIQMALGQQNTNAAKNAARIQVKCGGNARRKLKNGAISQSLYGGGNQYPFKITDGGGVLPLGNDGYGMLYQIVGDNHEQSHKAKSGRKTGVGFKFANGEVIEGEGNGNSNLGELLYVTPEDAYFISKHSIDGYNPAKAVLSGEHPLQAFANQEYIKDAQKHPRRRMTIGGNVVPMINLLSSTNIPYNDNSTLALMQLNQQGTNVRTTAKKGCRVKAADGLKWTPSLTGASISAGANLLGAGINLLGNYFGQRYMTDAYNKQAQYMTDAYSKMQGINMSAIDRDSFRAQHVMPALQSTVVNNAADREAIARAEREQIRQSNNTTLSGAARQNRLTTIADRSNQLRSQVTQAEAQQQRELMAANMQAANAAATTNAQLDLEASKQYTDSYLDLLQYNNNIENSKILGIAGANSDAAMGVANTKASYNQATAAGFANALTASAQGFTGAIDTDRTNRFRLASVLAGADTNAAKNALSYLGYSPEDINKMIKYTYNKSTDNNTLGQRPKLKTVNPIYDIYSKVPTSYINGWTPWFGK